MSPTDHSPIAFPVNVARLPKKGMPVRFEADEKQKQALAAAHGLQKVERLGVDLDVVGWKQGGVKVTGSVTARIVQTCTVTLEPVEETVDEAVSALFLPEGSRLAAPPVVDGEILLDAEGEDGPELFSGDTIDVGALAEEFFALGIDPYPRKQGVELPRAGDEDEKRGPLFEKLQSLRNKL